MGSLRTVKYIAQGLCAHVNPQYREKDEFGRCSLCGNFTRFSYGTILKPDSDVSVACGWDKHFTEEINVTNTLKCRYCNAKFRLRSAASSMLKYFWNGKEPSVADLVNKLRDGRIGENWLALETTAHDGIFTGFGDIKNIVRSEYFDDVARGSFKDGVRSEDLQALTFKDSSFDTVIALDVFEHIADPFKAFAEVQRVLKPSGISIITFPIDERVKKTKVLAKIDNGAIVYLGKRAQHNDPLRKDGSPVFTEFGTDIVDLLRSAGYTVSWDIYRAKRNNVQQRVLLLVKK